MSEEDSKLNETSKSEELNKKGEESTKSVSEEQQNEKNAAVDTSSEKEDNKDSVENESSEKKENGHSTKEKESPNKADSSLELKLDSTKESLKDEEEEPEEEGSMEEEESRDETESSPEKTNNKEKKSADVKGKRDRKKVERYVQVTKKEELESTGTGIALGDIPYIEKMIAKFSPEDLKILHRIAYNRPGTTIEIRKNLKKFKGFSFKPEDQAYERKKHAIEKVVMAELKKIAVVLGLERKGVKNDVSERVFNFLMNPQDLGKTVPGSKRKSKGKGKGKKVPRKSKEKFSKKDGAKSTKEGEVEESGEEEEDEDDEEEENEEEEEESEEEVVEEVKPKKQRKTPAKKVATPKAKNATPAKAKKVTKKRAKAASSDSEEDSEQEPLAKKVKKGPTDAEITAFIKKTLDKANLEEVTMKKLCQQVYDNYPKHDLSHKKEFIKSTVKSILS